MAHAVGSRTDSLLTSRHGGAMMSWLGGLSGPQLVMMVGCILGAAAFIWILITKRYDKAVALIGVLAMVVAAAGAWTQSGRRSGPPAPEIRLTTPAPGDSPTICYTVAGTVKLAPGQAIAVAVKEGKENRWYLDGRASIAEDGTWRAPTRLGLPTDREARFYEIRALVLSEPSLRYYQSTNRMRDSNHEPLTFWSSPGLPPDVLANDQRSVTRQGVAGGKC